MSVVLTIDQGNSNIKYSIFEETDTPVRTMTGTEPDLEAVSVLLDGLDLGGCIYATVARFDIRFAESLRRMCDDRLMVLTPTTPVPLKNKYTTTATLGVDRLAAAVAVTALYPGQTMLIADAGSALTLDLIADDMTYCGGTISPGISMRLKALHHFTSRLPETVWGEERDISFFPTTTEDAIISGAVTGVVAQIKTSFEQAVRLYPQCKLILTGGDAERIFRSSMLHNLSPLCQPELVPIGLNRIFRYNETLS